MYSSPPFCPVMRSATSNSSHACAAEQQQYKHRPLAISLIINTIRNSKTPHAAACSLLMNMHNFCVALPFVF
jgi:hypothetical protein